MIDHRSEKFVFDTNVILSHPECLQKYSKENIIIPMKVIEELEDKKTNHGELGYNARRALRNIDSLKLEVSQSDASVLPVDFNIERADDAIISTVMKHSDDNNVRFFTNDLSMKIRCKTIGVDVKKYERSSSEQNIVTPNEVNNFYEGVRVVKIDDKLIDRFYYEGELESSTIKKYSDSLCYNEYIVLESNYNSKKRAFTKFQGFEKNLYKLVSFSDRFAVWDIEPRNIEQRFSMDALMDEDISIVSLVGKAGTGKTLLAAAAGLQQVFKRGSGKKNYKKVIISRPIQTLGPDIGFLPGSIEEKMAPWVAPILDNLEVIAEDKEEIDRWFSKGKIEIEAMPYIRGRSISNAFVIIDEAQNLTSHEVKTILTRVGEGSKIVLTGDVQQIDNPVLTEFTNGLRYSIEKLKPYEITSHITLTNGERSEVATLAAEVL